MKSTTILLAALLGITAIPRVFAQEAKPGAKQPYVASDGSIMTIGGRIPFSAAASKEALKRFLEIQVEDKASPGIANPLASRLFYDKINSDRAARMARMFPVIVKPATMDGVSVAIVRAADSTDADDRVLINLHGGAYLWGAGSGGLVEAIPVASTSKIKVITVDYREGPENQFPAASEDVEKVYRALLAHHKPENIGIYGCSAGGGLTAQSLAWFQVKQLPMPGAIGVFCAGIWNGAGDSEFLGPMLMGQLLPSPIKSDGPRFTNPYFKGKAFSDYIDRLSEPGAFDAVIKKFPPTLLISGTRDTALSGTLLSNEMLTKAGVTTELHVWEGMWHSFFSDPELPESRAAYEVMSRFFNRYLGRASARDGTDRKASSSHALNSDGRE